MGLQNKDVWEWICTITDNCVEKDIIPNGILSHVECHCIQKEGCQVILCEVRLDRFAAFAAHITAV